jgi:hypothetical protein
MPYKDPEHNRQRGVTASLAAASQAARKAAEPEPPTVDDSKVGILWLPVAGAVALDAYNPKLAVSVGGFTLVAAATLNKSWVWLMEGVLTLALELFFQWSNQNGKEAK